AMMPDPYNPYRRFRLLHDNDVTRLKPDILVQFLPGQYFLVIEIVPLVVLVNDGDLLLVGEVLETTCVDQSLKYPGWNDQGILAGPVPLTVDEKLLALDREYCNRNVGVIDIGFDLFLDTRRQCLGCQTGCLHIADQVNCDLAVRTDHVAAGKLLSLIDKHRD